MITILGFSRAAIAADFKAMITQAGFDACVQSPEDFLAGKIDRGSEYLISVTRDLDLRRRLITALDQQELKRATFVHPSCWIDPTAKIGPGTFVGPFCTVAHSSTVGRDCLLPPYCLIGHGSTIGDDCLLDPGVTIAGSCNIGNNCKFNLRSSVIDKISICTGTEIGAGSMVTKNIDLPGTYVGTPARRVK